MSGTIEPSGGTNGAFLVEVTTELKEILIFRMLPFRSYEKIGMAIPFESPVQLQNVYNNGFLTYEKIGITPVDKSIKVFIQSSTWTRSRSWPTIPTLFP